MVANHRRILVVEDNPALAGVIRFNLEKAGFEVVCARNGRDAWQHLTTEKFDFVVTDHQMPEMTGSQLCERIRQNERIGTLPVIMLTAKGLELELSQLRRDLGVMDVLAKPFSPSELVQRIEQYFTVDAPAA